MDPYTSGWSRVGWEPRDPFDPEVDDTLPADEDEEEEEEWNGLQRHESEDEDEEDEEEQVESKMRTRSSELFDSTANH